MKERSKKNKMGILDSISNLLRNKENVSTDSVPEGICPNCWGRQEYGGAFYEAVKKEYGDVKSTDAKLGWIRDYVEKHLSTINLEKEDGEMVCQKCKVGYKPTE